MAFELPDLPFEYSALEPYIDEETMKFHHDKHHAAYVSSLNKLLEEHTDLSEKSIEELLHNFSDLSDDLKQGVANYGGGHANHSLFWRVMTPKPVKEPDGELAEAIDSSFGGFSQFKEKFTDKAMSVFGSGWAFLILDNKGKLSLKRHSFQNSPLMNGDTPLLGIDVWEHAYYLKYQNRRVDYINAWWNVVNWKEVFERFKNAA
jgi:Fe-Mn family superoxide dismutase